MQVILAHWNRLVSPLSNLKVNYHFHFEVKRSHLHPSPKFLKSLIQAKDSIRLLITVGHLIKPLSLFSPVIKVLNYEAVKFKHWSFAHLRSQKEFDLNHQLVLILFLLNFRCDEDLLSLIQFKKYSKLQENIEECFNHRRPFK